MAARGAERVGQAGLAPTYHAADAAGDSFPVGPSTMLHVKNASAAAVTATVVTPATTGGFAVDNLAVSIPAGGERIIGPITADLFGKPDGRADVTWSAVTSVTFAVLSL